MSRVASLPILFRRCRLLSGSRRCRLGEIVFFVFAEFHDPVERYAVNSGNIFDVLSDYSTTVAQIPLWIKWELRGFVGFVLIGQQ